LGLVGGGEVVPYQPRGESRSKPGGEAGRGLAVVVVGANEGTSSPVHLEKALMDSYWSVFDAASG
jgi:hypothetical protein